MKTIILPVVILALCAATASAQVNVNKPTPIVGYDASVIGRAIMDGLTPTLQLRNDQINQVTILIGQFLTKKGEFIDEMQSAPDAYQQKFNVAQKVLFDGLRRNLQPTQFTQLMQLKPQAQDANKPVSQLFY